MLEILFSPDGAGKSTVAQAKLAGDSSLVALHGTNLSSWIRHHNDLLNGYDLDNLQVPPDGDFEAKLALLSRLALIIADSGKRVLVDGHGLHKTTINIAAGRAEIAGAAKGTPVQELVDGPLALYYQQLMGQTICHTHVILPGGLNAYHQAQELQRRITTRGERTIWDPTRVSQSYDQVVASYQLADILEQRGAVVAQAIA